MSKLSSLMVALVLFGMMVTGPILYYSSLMTNVEDKYGVTITQSRNVSTYQVASKVIEKAETLQTSTEGMATGNLFTDFVGMLVAGLGTLSLFWDFTGIFTNIVDDFIGIVGISGEGGWISAGIMGIILIVITAKILSIVLNREV